ncbi:hypothetical protein UY3_12745 [Chelonia mydas]|uniref:Uncharacterized protein n=1 Tax=Chelonia mydas TaxID=8469 RepID=M7AZE8_CHEMY|nr:hypothetical protein UY3_12745 [Chelonia mydas]
MHLRADLSDWWCSADLRQKTSDPHLMLQDQYRDEKWDLEGVGDRLLLAFFDVLAGDWCQLVVARALHTGAVVLGAKSDLCSEAEVDSYSTMGRGQWEQQDLKRQQPLTNITGEWKANQLSPRPL